MSNKERETLINTLSQEQNIQKIENILRKFGVETKTADGEYRQLYDVLVDISRVVYKTKGE